MVFDSRGVLCYVSKWRHFLIAEVFSVSHPPPPPPRILTYKPEETTVNIEISEMDLACLEPGIYLNDRVIDFYLMYVPMSVPHQHTDRTTTVTTVDTLGLMACRYLWYNELGMEGKRVHIFSSFFHQRLMDSTQDLTGSKELRYCTALYLLCLFVVSVLCIPHRIACKQLLLANITCFPLRLCFIHSGQEY